MRLLPFLLLAACAPVAEPTFDDPTEATRLQESTPEALGVLALLNDGATTYPFLDDIVGLDRRAADSLIGHRDGPDQRFGTTDDDLFDTLEEADDQYYVGAAAIDLLLAFAEDLGFVVHGPTAGTWEGVPFTEDEAIATLALANEASYGFLDDDLGLDRRAVDGIFDARPMATMHELASAWHVGPSALTALREASRQPDLARPYEVCDTSEDCASGLVCLGEIAWGTGLFCVDDTMYGTFTNSEPMAITDEGETHRSHLEVSGLATVPVDVVLTLDIEHPRPSDLIVSVHNELGYHEVVWDREEAPRAEVVVRAFPSDDMVNGLYWVQIEDVVPGAKGTLNGWSLYIVSNWD